MARIIAVRDAAARYIYIKSGDSFAVPEDARSVIKRNGGDFSGESKSWRIPLDRGQGVVLAMRTAGHDVVCVDSDYKPPRPQMLECRSCAAPHGVMATRNGIYDCRFCGATPLELVPPHVCDECCQDRAVHRGES